MNDKEKLVELLKELIELPDFKTGTTSEFGKVGLYVNSGDERKDLATAFFHITLNEIEVGNKGTGLSMDSNLNSFSDFNFEKWLLNVKEEIVEYKKQFRTIAGVKYRLVPVPVKDKEEDEIPF